MPQNYQAIPGDAPPNEDQAGLPDRSHTSLAFSNLFGILHVVVGMVIPMAIAFNSVHTYKEQHKSEIQTWHLDFFSTYTGSVSVLMIIVMHCCDMTKTVSGNESHQAASVYLKGGAALFGACGMLAAGFKFCSVIDESYGHKHHPIHAVEACVSVIFIIVLWLFVCAHSDKCISKWEFVARLSFMLVWATCVCCWSRDFVTEVMEDISKKTFDNSICMNKTVQASKIGVSSADNSNPSNSTPRNITDDGGFNFHEIVENSSPFLIPGAMEYYLIMSGFLYVMYGNIGREPGAHRNDQTKKHRDLKGSYVGLGFGLLVFVASIIVVTAQILTSTKIDKEIKGVPSAIYYGFLVSIHLITISGNLVSLIRMRRSSKWKTDNSRIDDVRLTMLLMFISASGPFVSGIFSIIASALMPDSVHQPGLLLADELLKIIDIVLQVLFLYDALHRKPPTEFRPNFTRQIIIFLMITNFTIWWMTIYEVKAVVVSPVQYCFFGFEIWSIIVHLVYPLEIYFRFHSSLLYLEIWISG